MSNPPAPDAPVPSPSHQIVEAMLGDTEFHDFVWDICGRRHEEADRLPLLEPPHYFALSLLGSLEQLPSDLALEARIRESVSLRELLNIEADDAVPTADMFTATRALYGPRIHRVVVAWLTNGISQTDGGAAGSATGPRQLAPHQSLTADQLSAFSKALNAGAPQSSAPERVRPRPWFEQLLEPALTRYVFNFASNLATSGVIVAGGLWVASLQLTNFPRWLSLTASVPLLAIGVVLLGLLFMDAAARLRDLRAKPLIMIIVVVCAAITAVLIAAYILQDSKA